MEIEKILKVAAEFEIEVTKVDSPEQSGLLLQTDDGTMKITQDNFEELLFENL